jgi:phage FluMu gp28-like protein
MEGFWRFHQVGWAEQAERISDYMKRFPGPCVIDRTGVGDPTFQELHRRFPSRVHPFVFNAQKKNEIVKGLAVGFEKHAIKIAKVPELIAELQVFRCLDTGPNDDTRFRRYGAPNGLHDDAVISLALAWWGVNGGGTWGATQPAENMFREGLFA